MPTYIFGVDAQSKVNSNKKGFIVSVMAVNEHEARRYIVRSALANDLWVRMLTCIKKGQRS